MTGTRRCIPEHPSREPEGQGEGDVYETEVLLTAAGEDGLDDREREALAIAGKIRQLTGTLPVTDKETCSCAPRATQTS